MKKLTFYEMVEMLEIYNNGYCDFNTAGLKHNGKIYSGTVYRLCNELTKEQKAIFELFPNVVVEGSDNMKFLYFILYNIWYILLILISITIIIIAIMYIINNKHNHRY